MILIGEKINGSIPSVAKAIAERNEDWIRNLAKIQTEAGADFIDVCASVKDNEVVLALQMFYIIISLLGNLLIDIIYGFVDPRIRVNK